MPLLFMPSKLVYRWAAYAFKIHLSCLHQFKFWLILRKWTQRFHTLKEECGSVEGCILNIFFLYLNIFLIFSSLTVCISHSSSKVVCYSQVNTNFLSQSDLALVSKKFRHMRKNSYSCLYVKYVSDIIWYFLNHRWTYRNCDLISI